MRQPVGVKEKVKAENRARLPCASLVSRLEVVQQRL